MTAWYTDTVTNRYYVRDDPIDGRKHRPLGLEVEQRSFSWASGSASDFVIIEFEIKNIGLAEEPEGPPVRRVLRDVSFGLCGYVRAAFDKDMSHGYDDNITEFIGTHPSPLRPEVNEIFNTVCMADNDGDPWASGWDRQSATGVLGIAPLLLPTPQSGVSLNWWRPAVAPDEDWGPVHRGSKVDFIHGQLGAPEGDRAAYQMMTNFEIDYPSIETALDHQAGGWMPPPVDPETAADIANGSYMGFLLSVGPFDLPPDSPSAGTAPAPKRRRMSSRSGPTSKDTASTQAARAGKMNGRFSPSGTWSTTTASPGTPSATAGT